MDELKNDVILAKVDEIFWEKLLMFPLVYKYINQRNNFLASILAVFFYPEEKDKIILLILPASDYSIENFYLAEILNKLNHEEHPRYSRNLPFPEEKLKTFNGIKITELKWDNINFIILYPVECGPGSEYQAILRIEDVGKMKFEDLSLRKSNHLRDLLIFHSYIPSLQDNTLFIAALLPTRKNTV